MSDKMQKMTESILSNLNDRFPKNMFVAFKDGNTHNISASNLAYLSPKDALNHIDEIKSDWDMDLTKAEIELVRDPAWRAGLSFGPGSITWKKPAAAAIAAAAAGPARPPGTVLRLVPSKGKMQLNPRAGGGASEHTCKCGEEAGLMCPCKEAWYCSKECQAVAWPAHKPSCAHHLSKKAAKGQGQGQGGKA